MSSSTDAKTVTPRPPKSEETAFDPAGLEIPWYQWWDENGFFNASANTERESHTIMIPLPNVTGALHLGHALNNSLQDLLTRRARMQGHEAMWQPGTDHAGVATQSVVEKILWNEEKLTRDDLGYDKMLERIWEWKDVYEKRILGQLRRIGSSLDWPRTQFTMNPEFSRAVRYIFLDLFREGLIYRGKRLVNWSTGMESALSNDELVYKNVKGNFWYINYPVEGQEGVFVQVATTRPETMLADTAVAVHPNPRAELEKRLEKARVGGDEEKIAALEARIANDLPRLEAMTALIGQQVRLPLMERLIPVIGDEMADPTKGTGAVKITPAHDPNDYACGKRQNLPMINLLNPDGTLNDNAGRYAGLFGSTEGRERVVDDLAAQGYLVKVEPHEHEVAHCYRSHTVIEPYLSDQWFVHMEPLVNLARDCYTDGHVEFHPHYRGRDYLRWLDSTPDWCISRQIWWGHRIPVWSKAFPLHEVENLPEGLGDGIIEDTAWSGLPFTGELGEHAFSRLQVDREKDEIRVLVCVDYAQEGFENELNEAGFEQDPDVLDTWFSSQIWPMATLGWPDQTEDLDYFYPTTVLVTGRDILALWVARMIMMGMKYIGKTPFHHVLLNGTILDDQGNIMSKSRGNGFDPVKAIEGGRDVIDGKAFTDSAKQNIPAKRVENYKGYGCDAMRYGILSLTTGFTQDLKLTIQRTRRKGKEEGLPSYDVEIPRFEEGRRFCNKVWQASRGVVFRQCENYTEDTTVETIEDRWLQDLLYHGTKKISEHLDRFEVGEALDTFYRLFWDDFCSWYLEVIKHRLWGEDGDASRAQAQTQLANALDALMRLMHPFMPFVSEVLWQELRELKLEAGVSVNEEALIVAAWPTLEDFTEDATAREQTEQLRKIAATVNRMRSQQPGIQENTRLPKLLISGHSLEALEALQPAFAGLARFLRVEAIEVGVNIERPALCAAGVMEDLQLFLPLEDVIDVEAEIDRLEKQAISLEQSINRLEKQLGNENFVKRAPDHIVAQTRERLTTDQHSLEAVRVNLESLRNS